MSPAERVLIVGVSTRAAAESAARAGYVVTAIDAFGDLDQHSSVRALPLLRELGTPASAHAAGRVARSIESDAVAYLSNFENFPGAVSALAIGRALWGNPPPVLRRVRDPHLVTQTLRRRGCAAPAVCPSPGSGPSTGTSWLVKPLASGGGHKVRPWTRGIRVPRSCYLQEFVEGTAGSIAFVSADGRAVPLGLSCQLVGDQAFGATEYQYCGNILLASGDGDVALDAALLEGACALTRALTEEFELVGVNCVDFVARRGVPYAIEVNPRWSASMELVEQAYGVSVFGAHAAACAVGALPSFDLHRARRNRGAVGKAVVFARRDVTLGDTRGWLEDAGIRDVPHPGERILAGRPVCTVFAVDRDASRCRAQLVRRAERVYAEIAAA